MRREHNYPLYIGIALTALFVLLAIVGPSLAPRDPTEANDKVLLIDGQVFIPMRKPVAPGQLPKLFPLGTDDVGRDILSRLLFAFRPTLILCGMVVLVRMAVGICLGLVAGWQGRLARRVIDLAVSASLSVPALVFCVAVISFLGTHRGLVAFMVALSLTGWAETAAFVRNQTQATLQAPFIDSAKSVGVRPSRMLLRHVLPQLWPTLPALVAFEVGTVLLLVAELGFLGIYIGGGFVYEVEKGESADTWRMLTEGYPELGQMLSKVWAKILFVPWEPLIVGLVVFAVILAFNMLGEGFRRRLDVTRMHQAR